MTIHLPAPSGIVLTYLLVFSRVGAMVSAVGDRKPGSDEQDRWAARLEKGTDADHRRIDALYRLRSATGRAATA